MLFLYGLFPFLRKPLVRENHVLEMLQIVLYVAAIGLSIRNLKNFPKGWIRNAYGVIPIVGLVGVLEEASYGRAIFPISDILFSGRVKFARVRIDSVHDFFEVFYVWWGSAAVWGLVILFVIGTVTVVGTIHLGLRHKPKSFGETIQETFSSFPPLGYFMLCGIGLVSALILDLAKHDISFLSLMEESFETVAALALVYAALAIPYSPGKCQST